MYVKMSSAKLWPIFQTGWQSINDEYWISYLQTEPLSRSPMLYHNGKYLENLSDLVVWQYMSR